LFQRGKDVCDFELNEFQDILRVLAIRAIYLGVQKTIAASGDLTPGSCDDGFKVAAAGAGVVALGVGSLLADGHTLRQADAAATYTPTAWSGAGTDIQTIYIGVQEIEVADPAQLPQLGETTRRKKLQWTIGDAVAPAAVPADSVEELWEGGTRYFPIARIARSAANIAPGDITDLRKLLPASLMAMITRQADFKVAAVVGTIFETPDGVLLPKSKTVTIDVDPDGSLGPDGVFQVQFNRDDGGNYCLSFRVSHLGASTRWENPSRRIEFRDPNVENSEWASGHSTIPLTDANDGAEYLRIGEKGVNGTAHGVPSLVKCVNARHEIVVGNGGTNFGDFNGAQGVTDALTWWASQMIEAACTIRVKPGTYVVNAETLTGPGGHLVLQGTNTTECILRASVGSGPMLKQDRGGSLTLRSLTFLQDSGDAVAVETEGSLLVEDCVFDGTSIHYLIKTAGDDVARPVVCHRASFLHLAQSAFSLRVSRDDEDVGGFVFEDCHVAMGDAEFTPIEIVESGSLVNPSTVRGIVFKRSTFLLGSTTNSAGDPSNNVGVLSLIPFAGHAGKLRVEDIAFEDCYVKANAVSGVGTLLHLPQDATGDYVDLGTFAIKGGQWKIEDSSELTPFLLGLPFATSAPRVGQIVFEDARLGYTGSESVDYGENPAVTGGSNIGALFILSTPHLILRSVEFPVSVVNGRSGELLCVAETFDVYGVRAANWVHTAVVATPKYRVMFQSALWATARTGSGSVRNVHIKKTAGVGGVACSLGIFLLRPHGKLTLEDCSAQGFTTETTHHGFSILDTNADSPTFLSDGLTMTRCEASNLGGDGFHFYDDGAAAGTMALDHLTLTECRFRENLGAGISIVGDHAGTHPKKIGSVLLRGNVCEDNGGVGILYRPATWASAADHGPTLLGNTCTGNDSISAYQVHLEREGGGDAYSGSVYGNNFGETGLLRLASSSPGVGPRGTETGIDVSGGTTVTFADRVMTNGGFLFHNTGKLSKV